MQFGGLYTVYKGANPDRNHMCTKVFLNVSNTLCDYGVILLGYNQLMQVADLVSFAKQAQHQAEMESHMATVRAASSIRQRYFRYMYLGMKVNASVCSFINAVACLWISIKWKTIYDTNCYVKDTIFESLAHASAITQTVMLLWCTACLVTSYCMLINILKRDFPGMKQTKRNLIQLFAVCTATFTCKSIVILGYGNYDEIIPTYYTR